MSLVAEFYTTAQAPPYEYPKQVGGGGGKVSNLVITWEPLPLRDQNGDNLGYIVYWKEVVLDDAGWSTVSVRNFPPSLN